VYTLGTPQTAESWLIEMNRKTKYFSILLFNCLALPVMGEQGKVLIQVSDLDGKVVRNITLGTSGQSGGAKATDPDGKVLLSLPPGTKASSWMSIRITNSPPNHDFVMVSPWNSRALIPSFENGPDNSIDVVVAERSDVKLLTDHKAIAAIVANVLSASAPKIVSDRSPAQSPQDVLESVAKNYGLSAQDVDQAIRSWGPRATDPYDVGLADLYQKKYPEATAQLTASLDLREQKLKGAQEDVANAAYFLGQALYDQGLYSESSASLQRALKLNPDNPAILNGAGRSLIQVGDYDGAEKLIERALAIREKELGPCDPCTAASLNDLAELISQRGNYGKAEALYRRALSIETTSSGPGNPRTLAATNNLARLLEDEGQDVEAEKLLRGILPLFATLPESEQGDLSAVQNNLAGILDDKHDYAGAEQLYRQALAGDEKRLGKDHPDVAIALSNLGSLLDERGNYTEAESTLRRALAIEESRFGMENPLIVSTLDNLAFVLGNEKRYNDAEALVRRALAIIKKSFGPSDPKTAKGLENVAGVLEDRKDYTGAEALLREALAINEAADSHASATADSSKYLAQLLEQRGDDVGAEPLLRRALAIYQKNLGPDEPRTKEVSKNLAALTSRKH
jgi:tetratricopeptide (TPR) repeat protein